MMKTKSKKKFNLKAKLARGLAIFLIALSMGLQSLHAEQEETTEEYAKWGYGNEFLGAAHFWMFLWTYRFHKDFAANTGFSYLLVPGANYNADFLIFPVSISYLLGKNGHYFEPQAGFLFTMPAELGFRTADRSGVRASTTSDYFIPMVAAGYRYQSDSAGWFFRLSMYAYYGRDPKAGEYNIVYWPGISLGRTF